ncbi:MAG TPA: phosphate acyltransferase PlsX [Acidimicrobiia bacterium]|nr:phosphate acyltransferase PlsX [Acidimicrobiia bacterium]
MSEHNVTVAVDAMGGDRAPKEIVEGALDAARQLGIGVLLVGREDLVGPLLPRDVAGVELVAASDVVEMDEAATAVRSKKDASIVRCAQLVRDGRAQALVSAGNTGATMAAALLRIGRIRGVARPAIAAPIPVPGHRPQVLLDAGSTVDCAPEWLVQFAVMGREYARIRLDVDEPRIGLLSNGEEAGKGDDLRKHVFPLLADVPGFVGNVEGRDFMRPGVDVVVTDGFTGNVALKTLEGGIRGTAALVLGVLDDPELHDAASALMPHFLEAATLVDPDYVGGAVLLGVAGVCVVGHGSSSALAIVHAVRQAVECVEAGVVERTKEAIGDAR